MTAPHTNFRKGSHVFVHLKNGQRFDDVFEEKKGRFVFLRSNGRIQASKIRAMSYWRPQAEATA